MKGEVTAAELLKLDTLTANEMQKTRADVNEAWKVSAGAGGNHCESDLAKKRECEIETEVTTTTPARHFRR